MIFVNGKNRWRESQKGLVTMQGTAISKGKIFVMGTVVAVMAAACGSTSGVSSSSTSSTSTASKSVNIALIEPLTGPFADNGLMAKAGAELAVKQINGSGGIKGFGGAKINLVVRNLGNATTADAANITQEVISTSNPSAIVGEWASGFTLSASTVAEKAHIPMVTESFAGQIVRRGYKYVFKLPAGATLMGTELVTAVAALAKTANYPLHSAVLISDNTSSAEISAQSTGAEFKKIGVSIGANVTFSPGLTSAGPVVLKAMAAHPDVIYLNADLSDTALIQKALRSAGYHGPFIGAGGGFVTAQYPGLLGSSANGTFSTAGWNWKLPYPQVATFDKTFTATYPQYPFPGQEAGEDYTAISLIAQAIGNAHSSNPTAVRNALSALNVTSGPADIMPGGKIAFTPLGANKYVVPVLIQWQNGVPQTVYPPSLASAAAKFSF